MFFARRASRGVRTRRNFTLQFARNRIRRDLLPQLEREWNPADPRDAGADRRMGAGGGGLLGGGNRAAGRERLIEERGFVLIDVSGT